MESEKWKVVLDHRCELGEGPVWDELQQRTLWIDIPKRILHSYTPSTNAFTSAQLDQAIGSFTFSESGKIVMALQNGFHYYDEVSQRLTPIADPEAHLPDNRFNDGKCDPYGRFWAGSMHNPETEVTGNLYCLRPDGSYTQHLQNLGCSNGMAWSSDEKTMYYIDSPTRQVVAFDFSSNGISNSRVIITIPEEDGFPDGMTIDTDGNLWICLWDGWKVVAYNPNTGKRIHEIALPVGRITSCAFGGRNFDELYVTTASVRLSPEEQAQQPLAGSLFVITNIGAKGKAFTRFSDK